MKLTWTREENGRLKLCCNIQSRCDEDWERVPERFQQNGGSPHVWSRGMKRAVEDVTETPWGACLKMQSTLGSSCCVLEMLIFHVCSSEKGVLWSLTVCWNLQIIGFTSTWKAAILHDKNVRTIFRRIIEFQSLKLLCMVEGGSIWGWWMSTGSGITGMGG